MYLYNIYLMEKNVAEVDVTNIKVPEGQGFDKPVPKEKFEKKQ